MAIGIVIGFPLRSPLKELQELLERGTGILYPYLR